MTPRNEQYFWSHDMLWLSWNPWTDCPPVVDLKMAWPLEVCRSFENRGISQSNITKCFQVVHTTNLWEKKLQNFILSILESCVIDLGNTECASNIAKCWFQTLHTEHVASSVVKAAFCALHPKSPLYSFILASFILINSVPPRHPCFRKESNRSFCMTYVYSMTIYWPRAHEPPKTFYWPCKVIVPMIQAHKVAYKFHWCMVTNEGRNPKFCNSPSNLAKSPMNEANPIPSITLASYWLLIGCEFTFCISCWPLGTMPNLWTQLHHISQSGYWTLSPTMPLIHKIGWCVASVKH